VKLSEAIKLTDDIVRDNANKLANTQDADGLTASSTTALGLAFSTHSQYSPKRISQSIACGENGMILTSAINNFDEGFFPWVKIEFPIIPIGPPSWLDRTSFKLDVVDIGEVIRFIETIPGPGLLVRIVHCVGHVLPKDDTVDFTIRPSDGNALCHLAAAFKLQMLADFYGQTTNKPVGAADGSLSVFGTLSGQYMKLAALERGIYAAHMQAVYERSAIGQRLVRG
jgi:hypothetical protein